jgi:hypothetical protein
VRKLAKIGQTERAVLVYLPQQEVAAAHIKRDRYQQHDENEFMQETRPTPRCDRQHHIQSSASFSESRG